MGNENGRWKVKINQKLGEMEFGEAYCKGSEILDSVFRLGLNLGDKKRFHRLKVIKNSERVLGDTSNAKCNLMEFLDDGPRFAVQSATDVKGRAKVDEHDDQMKNNFDTD
ncbi:S-adenosyl-L-methionine-dependentmethyltransferases superfamily protein [Striga asiatica]|uniref:S-adenosyl-L-methionine-dependentmethyltransferases superfamily protein n=1 Tax=Striga asiatica TaxID=4170 RepID=A0A5A7QCH4_STRAF|nr:S-adenosyl-L-methionine-dependentmethyltransferases superfamily protein [Striga asiatica]